MAIATGATVASTASTPSAASQAAAGLHGISGNTATLAPSQRTCAQCRAEIVRRRRTSRQNQDLCTACDQRERRAAYFRNYYEEHKDRILDKNRRWARDNKTRIVSLRQTRRAKSVDGASSKSCLDCDTPVTRAERCRKCYIRFRYATDPTYRARRLATTRRWLDKRQQDPAVTRRTTTRVTKRSAQMIAN